MTLILFYDNPADREALLMQDQIPNELASGKVFLQGTDTRGRCVFVVLAKQQEKGRPEETKRCICYTLDNAVAACDPALNELRQFVCLFDLSGQKLYCHDITFVALA